MLAALISSNRYLEGISVCKDCLLGIDSLVRTMFRPEYRQMLCNSNQQGMKKQESLSQGPGRSFQQGTEYNRLNLLLHIYHCKCYLGIASQWRTQLGSTNPLGIAFQ